MKLVLYSNTITTLFTRNKTSLSVTQHSDKEKLSARRRSSTKANRQPITRSQISVSNVECFSLKSVSLHSVLQRTLLFDLIFQQSEKKKSKVRCVDPCCYLLSGAIVILLAVINMCIVVTRGPSVQAQLLTPPCPTFLCYMAASVSSWFSLGHFNALYSTHNSAPPCTAHPVLTLPTIHILRCEVFCHAYISVTFVK